MSSAAAQSIGVGRRTLTRWLSWYREGGLEKVLSRVPGHGALGNECWLTLHQHRELVERAGRGEFRTYEEARRWVEQQWGVEYRYKGIYALQEEYIRPVLEGWALEAVVWDKAPSHRAKSLA